MLFLIGTGISKNGLTIEAIDICKRSKTVFFDNYTSHINDITMEYLSKNNIIPKQLARAALEEQIDTLLLQAKDDDVSVLIGGDPMLATTHKIIQIRAYSLKIPVTVIHAGSIMNALMGESGLDFYRFGKIATITRWSQNYKPISFYDSIIINSKNDMHTILLCDFDSTKNESIPLSEALLYITNAEEQKQLGFLDEDKKIIIFHNVGLIGEKRVFCSIKEAKKLQMDLGMHAIIVPSRTSQLEIEMLNVLYGR